MTLSPKIEVLTVTGLVFFTLIIVINDTSCIYTHTKYYSLRVIDIIR